MNLSDLLVALGLVIGAESTWFLARGFWAIGTEYLSELAAGAILVDSYSLSGGRPLLVNAACRQKADALCGISLLLLSMILQFCGLAVRHVASRVALPFLPTTLVLVVFPLVILILGERLTRRRARSLIITIIRSRVLSQSVPTVWECKLSPDEERELRAEIGVMLKGLLNEPQLESFFRQFVGELGTPKGK